jgi:hypothetical protein
MHHAFRPPERNRHGAGDLEPDSMEQTMSGKQKLSLSEPGLAAAPKLEFPILD